MEAFIQTPRDVVSPREGKRWNTPAPLIPGTPEFADSLREVEQTVARTQAGEWSGDFLSKQNPSELEGQVPRLLAQKLRLGTNKNPRPVALAQAVSMDKPWHLGEFLHDELRRLNVPYKVDKPGTIQFCDKDGSMAAFMGDLNRRWPEALDRMFDIKYYWKQPRPEDFFQVHGTIFTVNGYPAPGHWSYGAGHGAVSGVTANVVKDHFDLSPDLYQEVLHACWCFAQGRTFLGVHFHEDNVLGFKVGRIF
jgi:hypothetical protein